MNGPSEIDVHPTTLSPEAQRMLDEAIEACRARVLEDVAEVLRDLERPELQELCYRLAFKPSDVLPKRTTRPNITPVHLSEQVYLAHGGDRAGLPPLRRFTVLVQEYYDILDDLVDGDVRQGHETHAMLVSQLLMPPMLRWLSRVHPDAIEYWSARAQAMVGSLYLEKCKSKAWDTYLASVRQQSLLFGFCTGLAALGAGAESQAISSAEELGCLAYGFSQFLLDLEQREQDRERDWNALHFRTMAQVIAQLKEWAERLRRIAGELPAPHDVLSWGLYSLDLDALERRLAIGSAGAAPL